jgi:thymidylate synthase (FAD)
MHFLSLRTENEGSTYPSHPQKEIQMVADQMEQHLANTMPMTYDAWNKNGRVAP